MTLSMPVMDGWAMLKELRGDPCTASVPIIALTAHAMVGDRDKALAAGFQNYLTKPLQPATFVSQLLTILADVPHVAQLIEGHEVRQ